MKSYKAESFRELNASELIIIEGGAFFSAISTSDTPGLPGLDHQFNKDWGWVGSGLGGQNTSL
ncbi:hypothetical protein [Aquimarina megaterium]|uniref:hypothetical protein n=1 Tax=Aquimarina megaterium TaxID=1443666 RepID=UPI000945BA6F|nr:hypothetical protein [Aquimarina megaterium]